MKRFQITLILLVALLTMGVMTQIKLKDIAPGAANTTPVSNGTTWTATALSTALEGTGVLIPKVRSFRVTAMTGSSEGAFGDVRPGTGTITFSGGTATDPPYGQFATSTVNGNCSTSSGNLVYVAGKNLYSVNRLKISSTANIRIWYAFTDQTVATMCASADPAGNYAGIRFDTVAGDTQWTPATKDNATQQLGASLTTAADTNWHYFEIVGNDSGTPQYTFKVDGVALSTPITAHLPTATTPMRFVLTVTCLTCTPTANNFRSSFSFWEANF